jgi:hypothetical protein
MLDQYDLIIASEACVAGEEIQARDRQVLGGGSFANKLAFDEDYKIRVMQTAYKDLDRPQTFDSDTVVRLRLEGWFDAQGWLDSFALAITHHRLMPGECGPLSACMGCVVTPLTKGKLFAAGLESISSLLRQVEYLGPFSVELLCEGSELAIMDLHAGFAYDQTLAWFELLRGKAFDFLYQLALPSRQPCEILNDCCALSVRLMIQDGWLDKDSLVVPEGAVRHFWSCGVATSGVVGCVSSRGAHVREAQRRAYRTIKNICASPDIMYRNDIGTGVEDQLARLHKWGWIDG